jgi:hypothetical protein
VAKLVFGGIEVDPDAHQPLGEAVVDLAEQPVALGRRGLGPGPLPGGLVHAGGGQRDRRVPGEQLEQFGVVGPEDPALVPAEHDAGADDAAAPFQRHADDPPQRGPVLRRHVPAPDLVIAGEPDRGAARHHRSGHPLGEREDPAGLARHADIGFLAVRAGRLVHAADRTRVAAEQLGAPAQDPLQQRVQRELAGQVLGHRDQAGGPRGGALLARRWPRRAGIGGHTSSGSAPACHNAGRLAQWSIRASPV